MSVRDIAVVGFAHAPHVRRTDGTTNGVEMLMPCFAQLYDELGITKADIGFWVFGFVGLPGWTSIFVHLRDRLHRSRTADQRIARRDGRRLGTV